MSKIVDELNALLKPSWGAEKWILEGWNKINDEEKSLIKMRMDELFKEGLPFEIKQDKLLYIYTFSLLAQLEVLAIQVPLKFENTVANPLFRQQLHTQLLDEIFHGLVFTKIVYELCSPHASPPQYNESIELLCNLVRNEVCTKLSLVMLNLVAEGWIEEVFRSLYQQQVAPKVFEIILKDEHRHVCEADLYREIGIPAKSLMEPKLEALEMSLLNNILTQPQYTMALSKLLGMPATKKLIQALHEKHTQQLKKIHMHPSGQWRYIMQVSQNFFEKMTDYSAHQIEVPLSETRKVFSTQWNEPGDPTMVGQFDLDVTCLDIFNKKYPSETLTTLFLQAVSYFLSGDPVYRSFFCFKQFYQSGHTYVSLVVKLPQADDHVGSIVFKDCHLMSLNELASKIRRSMQMMTLCYKKREQLEKKYPDLKQMNTLFQNLQYDVYPYPSPGNSVVSVSNIGASGYYQAISPLRKNEGFKITLMTLQRKQVWNALDQGFEIKDMLPVSLSADHRIFNGDIPVPKLLHQAFQHVFQNMGVQAKKSNKDGLSPALILGLLIDKLLAANIKLGYQMLTGLQTMWHDYLNIEDIFKVAVIKNTVVTNQS